VNYYLHPKGICESDHVGSGTRIWAFAHVLPKAVIGADCNICDHVFIENDVVIGDRTTVKCGVQLWDGIRLEDDVFIGPNVTFTNDRFPRSKVHQSLVPQTVVRRGASLGANCTVLPGLRIGQHAMVGAGSVVTHDVPPYAIVMGNPARIEGYVDSQHPHQPDAPGAESEPAGTEKSGMFVAGVRLYDLRTAEDMRGRLAVGHFNGEVPFPVKRFFVVYDVPSKYVRGEHAHRVCHQFLVCVHGNVTVMVDDGHQRQELILDKPSRGLHIPPMVWAVQYKYTPDARLLVFASEDYDPDDYIRDYDDFLAALAAVRQNVE